MAVARGLVAQADAARNTDPRLALLLGIAAHRLHSSPETQVSLVTTLTSTHYVGSLTGPTNSVGAVGFALDGRTLATASDDQTAILWDVADRARPRQLARLTGHTGAVGAVGFALDGRTLATGSDDQTAILWDLIELNDFRNRPVQHACTLTGRGLNRDEWAQYVSGLPYRDTCAP